MLASTGVLLVAGTGVSVWAALGGLTHPNVPDASGIPLNDVAWWMWFCSNWMFIHAAVGVLIIVICLMELKQMSTNWGEWWVNMMCANYMAFHQFEEHAWDIYGRRYPFVGHLATIMGCNIGETTFDPYIKLSGDCWSDQEFIAWVNTFGVFSMVLPQVFFPRVEKDLAAICCFGVITGNAVLFHLIPAFKEHHYNPGLVQSILFNAPVGILLLRAAYKRQMASNAAYWLAVVWGVFFGIPLYAAPPYTMSAGMVPGSKTVMWIWIASIIPSHLAVGKVCKLLGKPPPKRI